MASARGLWDVLLDLETGAVTVADAAAAEFAMTPLHKGVAKAMLAALDADGASDESVAAAIGTKTEALLEQARAALAAASAAAAAANASTTGGSDQGSEEASERLRELGLPEIFVGRHPFPGPGLAIRCPGGITREKLDILRKADAIYLDEIRKAGLYDTIWQAFAVLLPVRTVGVMGDGRTYDHVCALRAVTSVDGMTADFFPFDMNVLGRTATRIINEVKGINRVVYDVTSKPPGTIEWE